MRAGRILAGAILYGLALVVHGPAFGQATPAQSAFRDEMAQRLSTALGRATVSPVADDWQQLFVDRPGQDHDLTVNLGRIWSYCEQANKADCENVKTAFISKTIKEPPPASSKDLRVIVRDETYVDYLRSLQKTDKSAIFLIKPIGEDLYELLAVDGPETIALVNESTLDKLKLSTSEAWALAESQTAAILPKLPTAEQLTKNPVAFQDFDYLGSLLVQREAFGKLAAAVGPDLFVTAVSDRFVFVATMPDGPGLEKFAGTVRDDCKAQERCLSPYIYRFRNGQWRIATNSGH